MNSYNPHLVTVDTRYLNIGYLDVFVCPEFCPYTFYIHLFRISRHL